MTKKPQAIAKAGGSLGEEVCVNSNALGITHALTSPAPTSLFEDTKSFDTPTRKSPHDAKGTEAALPRPSPIPTASLILQGQDNQVLPGSSRERWKPSCNQARRHGGIHFMRQDGPATPLVPLPEEGTGRNPSIDHVQFLPLQTDSGEARAVMPSEDEPSARRPVKKRIKTSADSQPRSSTSSPLPGPSHLSYALGPQPRHTNARVPADDTVNPDVHRVPTIGLPKRRRSTQSDLDSPTTSLELSSSTSIPYRGVEGVESGQWTSRAESFNPIQEMLSPGLPFHSSPSSPLQHNRGHNFRITEDVNRPLAASGRPTSVQSSAEVQPSSIKSVGSSLSLASPTVEMADLDEAPASQLSLAGEATGVDAAFSTAVTEPMELRSSISLSQEQPVFSHHYGNTYNTTNANQGSVTTIHNANNVFLQVDTGKKCMARSLVASLQAVLQLKSAFGEEQQEFKKLEERIKFLNAILESFPQDASQDARDRRDGLERAIQGLVNGVQERMRPTGAEKLVLTNEEGQEMLRLAREVNFAIEISMLDVAVRGETLTLTAVSGIDWLKDYCIKERHMVQANIRGIQEGVAELRKAELFKSLGDVKHFSFSRGTRRRECVAGSRVGLLSQLLGWAEDPTSSHAFWLNGIAGTGKTAVAETFCSHLSKRGLLGASFFCSITSQNLSDVYLIIPSLARALARAHPRFSDALATALSELSGDEDPLEMKLEDQYHLLILRPSEAAFKNYRTTVALCVDALDECRDKHALKQFLDAILSKKSPTVLKIFFTSRPESSLVEHLSTCSTPRQTLRLHDIERDIVQADIKLYIHHELGKVKALRDKYGDQWPPPEVQTIIEHAGTLFIVAATMVRHIAAEVGNRVKRLQALGSPSAPKLLGVHQLYEDILEKAFVGLEADEKRDVLSCLSLLVVARQPLTVDEYAQILGRPPSAIREALRPLHSVVFVAGDGESGWLPIRIYHASFVDFLTAQQDLEDHSRWRTCPWLVDRVKAHAMVAERCIVLMEDGTSGLHFGISGAVTSYRSNEGQPTKLSIRSDLAYACTSWGDHALGSKPIPDDLQRHIKGFIEAKWLFWIEALSVEQDTRYARILWEVSKEAGPNELKALLTRISDFGRMFARPIGLSAPHLYLSALPFCDAAMGNSDWILPKFPSAPIVSSTGLAKSSRSCKVLSGPSSVWSVAASPNGNTVVTGCGDGFVRVWDMWTGEMRLGLKGHGGAVKSVDSSPDGKRIVSGSNDGTIRVWDVATGKVVLETLEKNPSEVISVCFSKDGTRIISGFDNTTIGWWDAATGQMVPSPLAVEGLDNSVHFVGFSQGGERVVSVSADHQIRVHSARTGAVVLGPLEGHTDSVSSVAFSPDEKKIVSGSEDKTVRLWNAETGDIIASPLVGHTDWVTSVCFSPDGKAVASGSWDGTVKVWNAEAGGIATTAFEGHTDGVQSVCFTRDGSKIISGSYDGTVRIWDTKNAQTESGPLQACIGPVHCVQFSPDGTGAVSGFSDGTLGVWDVETGHRVIGPLRGHTMAVRSVDFSPDGRRIVSVLGPLNAHATEYVSTVCFSPDGRRIAAGSGNTTRQLAAIEIWDGDTGDKVRTLGPLDGSSRGCTSVLYSPCGRRIASGSDRDTITVWDTETGAVLSHLKESGRGVAAVCFTPDGTKIVSGSNDGTIGVRDAQTGDMISGSLEGHTGAVNLVSCSRDGKFIASGSGDHIIRIWDAENGEAVLGPLVGHTSWVNSVHFSPDGKRVVSGSEDGTIRIWNVQRAQPALSRPIFLHNYSAADLIMHDDGWIRNSSGDLLLWIPPQFRPSLCTPSTERIIGGPQTTVELTHALHHGSNWLRCIEPRSDKPLDGLPWPITRRTAEGSPA
ncbi:hypothetical protein NMY22_g6734 [Coprinellus aureogranulatus]|nr:hypothetical protein NMY22_g6734 [Coprinellus aureogranulatus]